MKCPSCGADVPKQVDRCVVCQADVGFPNVRVAETQEEKTALDKRLNDAKISARARKCENVLDDFGRAVAQSKAVLTRHFSQVLTLASSDNALYTTFHNQIAAEARLPEEGDRNRASVDMMLFPFYYPKIIFAALSLSNRGPVEYGDYTIVLKEKLISQRATVFEENSRHFCTEKHKLVVGDPIPSGHRALWNERDKLAMAKLHSELDVTTAAERYPEILLRKVPGQEDDFIEVHIYGPIHRNAIERLVGPQPKKKQDRLLFEVLKQKLQEIKAPLEEI